MDIAFAFDSSSNVEPGTFQEMKTLSTQIVQSFRVSSSNARFASLTFSNQAAVDFGFNQYDNVNDVIQAIQRIGHQQRQVNLESAFEIIKKDLFSLHSGIRTARPKILVFFYGGSVVMAENKVREMVAPLEKYGVKIVVIGMVGANGGGAEQQFKRSQLNLIAQSPSTVFVGTSDELKTELYLIGSEISRGS